MVNTLNTRLSLVTTGIVCILCPTYVAEIATPNNRGFLGSMVQIMVTIGVLQVSDIIVLMTSS